MHCRRCVLTVHHAVVPHPFVRLVLQETSLGILQIAMEKLVTLGRVGHRSVRPLDIFSVLARVGSPVLEPLEQAVHSPGEESTHEGSQPVDPVVADEAGNHGRAEGTSRVDGGAGVIGPAHVRHEDGDADANGGQEGGTVLLDGEEVDGQDELRSEEHLEEETTDDADVAGQGVSHEQRAGDKTMGDGGSRNACHDLGRDDHESTERLDSTDEKEAESNSGVKHATGDTVEDPHIDSESTTEAGGDVHQTEREERAIREPRIIGDDGSLSTNEGEQQEHEGTTKLSQDDGESIAEGVRDGMLAFALLGNLVTADVEDLAELRVGRHGGGGL